MKIQLSEKIPSDALHVVFVTHENSAIKGVRESEFSGAHGSICFLRGEQPMLYVGLGKAEKLEENCMRKAAGVAVKQALALGFESLALGLGAYEDYTQATVEGVILGSYKFEAFLQKDARRKYRLKSLCILAKKPAHKELKTQALRGQILAEGANVTREVGNQPANVLTPAELATHARSLARKVALTCKVWDEKALKKEGFGGILAVGQGSVNPPRLIRLDYACGKKKAPTLVVVGKAITFDTGGISLKPGAAMDEMKFDKMGGVTVLGIMQAVAKLKVPVNVIGLIASAENMPDGRAYRPGDIVTTWDGKTIEVLNTDAEGRIVLADALAYAREKLKPDFMVDLATLTGACLVALGRERAGLFTEDSLAEGVFRGVGENTGDRVWPLPVGEEFSAMMKSEIATVKNLGGGRYGGASSAASFLQNWVGDIPWAHLDIAGTAWTTSAKPHLEVGATGFGVRLVVGFAEQYFKK